MVIFTWNASILYKVHKLHQQYILKHLAREYI